MEPFLGEHYLLDTDIARELYLQYTARMPIIDYHCRLDPKELWEDWHFEIIAQLWLGSGHYEWRLMRSNGVEECFAVAVPENGKSSKSLRKLCRGLLGIRCITGLSVPDSDILISIIESV